MFDDFLHQLVTCNDWLKHMTPGLFTPALTDSNTWHLDCSHLHWLIDTPDTWTVHTCNDWLKHLTPVLFTPALTDWHTWHLDCSHLHWLIDTPGSRCCRQQWMSTAVWNMPRVSSVHRQRRRWRLSLIGHRPGEWVLLLSSVHWDRVPAEVPFCCTHSHSKKI